VEFIDCNTRVGMTHAVISPLVNPTPETLISRMDFCGVSSALCRHEGGRENGAEEGNRCIDEIHGAYPRLKSVYTVTPLIEEELGGAECFIERAKDKGVAALRIHPKEMLFSPAPYALERVAEIAAAIERPIMVDMEEIKAEEIAALAKSFPHVNFIVTAIYYRNLRNLCPIIKRHDNVYLETGFLKTFRSLEDLCRLYGPERLVFGSGAPYFDMGGAKTHLLGANIGWTEKEMIAGGNIKRICGGLEV